MGAGHRDLCDSGEIQTMSHIVDACPLTKFEGGLQALRGADEAAADGPQEISMAYENNCSASELAIFLHSFYYLF